jgi:hypothetical protein
MVRPQCFPHSRRFTPSNSSRAYFISQPRLGFSFQGLSLQPSLKTLLNAPCPLVVVLTHLLLPYASWLPIQHLSTEPVSRPFTSRLSSKLQSVAICRGINPTNRSIPSYGFNSPRLFFKHRSNAFTLHPFLTFCGHPSL